MKDYTPYNAYHAPAKAVSSGFGDVREQFTATGEMVVSTLRHALHTRTRELDAALAKIAILELRIKYHEQDPLRLAYDKLTATEQPLIFVGELRCDAHPVKRVQASGELLAVLETLHEQYRVFSTQVIELNVSEKKAS